MEKICYNRYISDRPAKSKPRYLVQLEASPDDSIPAIIRLRRFLKCALRSFGLRCVSVEEIPSEPKSEALTRRREKGD